MTKEELGKEAVNEAEELKEYQTAPKNEYEKGFNNGEIRGFKDGYLAGAEPREKRIAELEKEIAKMKSVGRTSYIKGIRTMSNALKNYDRTDGAWTDYFEHTVDKVLKNLLEEIKEK